MRKPTTKEIEDTFFKTAGIVAIAMGLLFMLSLFTNGATAQQTRQDLIVPIGTIFSDATLVGCIDAYDCLDEIPHDGSFSYVDMDAQTFQTAIVKTDVWIPTGTNPEISEVSLFYWARSIGGSVSGNLMVELSDATDVCATIIGPTLNSWINFSIPLADCGGIPWTNELINSLQITALCMDDGFPPAEPDCYVTSMGLVVSYTSHFAPASIGIDVWLLLVLWLVFVALSFLPDGFIFALVAGIVGIFLSLYLISIGGSITFVAGIVILAVSFIMLIVGSLSAYEEFA